ncbi:MAG: 2-oxoisovalerate dehydrogenase [Acidobacteriota bacterium]|nr:2-oxoisovalerate dehydrogenase [Acidobacteriota bacterium]
MAEVKEALRSEQDELRREEIIFAVEESPEDGYEAQALGYAIFTQADTMDELKTMVQDAVRCHFEDSLRPRVIRLHLVKDEVILA